MDFLLKKKKEEEEDEEGAGDHINIKCSRSHVEVNGLILRGSKILADYDSLIGNPFQEKKRVDKKNKKQYGPRAWATCDKFFLIGP